MGNMELKKCHYIACQFKLVSLELALAFNLGIAIVSYLFHDLLL